MCVCVCACACACACVRVLNVVHVNQILYEDQIFEVRVWVGARVCARALVCVCLCVF